MTAPDNNILSIYPEKNKNIDEINLDFFSEPFVKGFIIENDGQRCNPKLIKSKKIGDIKEVRYQFDFICKKPLDNLHFIYNLFFDVSVTHENITDIHLDNFSHEIILSKDNPTIDINYAQFRNKINNLQLFTNIITFLKLGVNHILTGYDHILFLLGLLLVTKYFRNLLKIITSFTIAHSITLILATLGIFVLPARFTEPIIALSIAYVAFENLEILTPTRKIKWYKKFILADVSKRWIVAFLFGLIHGFGFSSALRELGLPHNGLLLSLISFNVGVEIGQLCIVALMFPILWYIRRQRWEIIALKYASITIGIIGLFWFIQRAFF